MLDELCPVQFIEGINEGAKYGSFDELVNVENYNELAIEYNARKNYSLTRVDLVIFATPFTKELDVRATLLSDYEDKPTNIVLSKGTFVPQVVKDGRSEYQCVQIKMEPVVIIRDNKYWLTIEQAPVYLAEAKGDFIECILLNNRGGNIWYRTEEREKIKIILKFYGRVLPIAI